MAVLLGVVALLFAILGDDEFLGEISDFFSR